ncbi:MAG: glycosyltransferase family 39 protein [Planctomycetota bacterium]|jgi:hypothetical protein
MRAVLFHLGMLAGLLYLLPKSLGLLSDVGGSKLNRSPEFELDLDLPTLVVLIAFVAAGAAIYRLREALGGLLDHIGERAESRPLRVALTLGLLGLLLHAALFVPFRLNCLRLPDPADEAYEHRGGREGLERVPRRGTFEDNTRNLVTASAVRRLGPSRYFRLHEAEELTRIERNLCRWALTNHPPGYHLLLAPFTTHPVIARATSVVLYAVVTVLAFLLLRALLGGAAALAATVLFWAVPSNMFFLGMMTTNDLAVAAVILLGLVVATTAPRPSPARLVVAGAILGVALLVKYTAPLAVPWVLLLLLTRQGLRRGLRSALLLLAGLVPVAAVWFLVVGGTEWGGVHWDRYVGRLLATAVDPAHIGKATSTARGSTLDFLVYIPVELGFPLASTLAVALLWWLTHLRKAGVEVFLSLLLYGVSFAAAFLVIPKTNYIFFALPGLCGVAGAFLARRSRSADAAALVAVVLVFGILRTVLYGIQTW